MYKSGISNKVRIAEDGLVDDLAAVRVTMQYLNARTILVVCYEFFFEQRGVHPPLHTAQTNYTDSKKVTHFIS